MLRQPGQLPLLIGPEQVDTGPAVCHACAPTSTHRSQQESLPRAEVLQHLSRDILLQQSVDALLHSHCTFPLNWLCLQDSSFSSASLASCKSTTSPCYLLVRLMYQARCSLKEGPS